MLDYFTGLPLANTHTVMSLYSDGPGGVSNQLTISKLTGTVGPQLSACLNATKEFVQINWSTTSLLSFHSSKSTHLSFKCKFTSTYNINGNPINTSHLHKDLGVLISDNLNWNEHHDYILKKAYKTLGLLRRTFCKTIVPLVTLKLYISLVRSQLLYCAPVWRPHLLKDISKIEQLQRRATKYILQDFSSDYKTRLTKLNLLPLMYIFEISDIIFFVNSLKHPTPSFNINHYKIQFSQATPQHILY